jgi:Na+-driven multidrug efflux pump
MERSNSQYIKMTQMPVGRLITSLAVPTIISMLVSSIYNMADTYFVSKLGTSASGAVGIVFSLMAIIQSVGFTLGMGSGSLISRLLGAHKAMKRARLQQADSILRSFLAYCLPYSEHCSSIHSCMFWAQQKRSGLMRELMRATFYSRLR